MPDPWAEFHLEDIATERATRHRSAARPGAPNGPRPPGVLGGGGAPLLDITEPRAPLGIKQVPASTRVRTFKAPRVNSRSPQRGPAQVQRARPSSVAVTNTPGS